MKTNLNRNFFNSENPLKNNKILFVFGLFFIVSAVVMLSLINPVITFKPFTLGGELAILFVLGMLFFLGTILVVVTLNMKNSIAKVVLGALLLSFVILAVLKESMRYAFIVLLVSWVIFVAVNVFGKVFSAFYTFIIFCIPTIILLSFLLENYPNLNQSITLFSCFAVMLVIYNISGVKINCFFMSKVLGYGPDKIEQ